ncbi:flavin reductase family protein [Pseudohalocynthiibacter aestuariivivens]|nr:flavin reductase family protein [Pseudohalocynthiibacter aestuariivivens]QIE46004.1 flavin reductase family protein [Pseudohalocynthiibacter aestuariivivens]
MSNTQGQFKAGMQLLAASTTIITSAHEGARAGMTATAVSSLTADPPSLLICTNRTSRTYGYIMDSRKFVVNVVPDDMPEIVGAFSSKETKEMQFARAGTWLQSEQGLPVLKEAVVAFECWVDNWANTKTHAVFFGMVNEVHLDPERSALIYARQGFHKLISIKS